MSVNTGFDLATYTAKLASLPDAALAEECAVQATLNRLHCTDGRHLAVVSCQLELERRGIDLGPVVAEVNRRVRAERRYS
jgi:hypothetical protein